MHTCTNFDITGRQALVTGGGSGIGLAIARGLAEHGADVCLWGRSEAKLQAAIRELTGLPGAITSRRVDVSDESEVIEGFESLEQGLDIAAVNAGLGSTLTPFLNETSEHYREIMSVNLDGAFWTIREAAKAMTLEGASGLMGGSIIVISSLAAVQGAGLNQSYAASKAGVLAIANGAAVELARHHIRVNSILPGWIATEMTTAAQASNAFTERVIARVPMRRWGRPEELAGAAVYLASDAARYQTGTTTVIDGGYSMF